MRHLLREVPHSNSIEYARVHLHSTNASVDWRSYRGQSSSINSDVSARRYITQFLVDMWTPSTRFRKQSLTQLRISRLYTDRSPHIPSTTYAATEAIFWKKQLDDTLKWWKVWGPDGRRSPQQLKQSLSLIWKAKPLAFYGIVCKCPNIGICWNKAGL